MKRFLSYIVLTLILISSPAFAAWDKDKPAGNTKLNLVDDAIRANNSALETAIAQDHDFVTSSTQTGKHKQVTFKTVLATKPTLSSGEGALYTKTYNSKSELFYEDSDGNEFLVMVPVGTILPYIPGAFISSANAGYTYKLGGANTVAAINTLLNPYGWYVCNGAGLSDATSPIFYGSGWYLPNLTDDRFLMGDTVAGGTGGSNTLTTSDHTHTTGDHTLTINEMPSHAHSYSYAGDFNNSAWVGTSGNAWWTLTSSTTGYTGGGQSHNHGSTGSAGGQSLENRPAYLSCFYIMRVH